jgi:hypothetical protein
VIGRVGVRAECWLAWRARVAGEPLDAELSATALRILALWDPFPRAALGAELAAGLTAQITHIEAAGTPDDAEALSARSSMSWAPRLYAGARWNPVPLVLALGAALELDPVQVEYGVRHPDGFVVSHAQSRVRPSLLAAAGVAW